MTTSHEPMSSGDSALNERRAPNASVGAQAAGGERLRIWTLIRRYKAASAGALVALMALALTIVASAFSNSSAIPLKDSTTCSEWSVATAAQRSAYAQLYIGEHAGAGALAPDGVVSAINADCTHAAYLGEADDLSVLAALQHAY